MEVDFTSNEEVIFRKVAAAAEAIGVPCYLVGGFVRDKLLNRPTKDADFVCVGDALALATLAAKSFRPQPKVTLFKNFGTAHFKLHDGFDLEFVGARKESY
ncbi:MAG TPA: poly-A polymerase, partial [Flavisolibacter sp.]|nr:poly-A polymerase [Flavisolibacter sp.]